MPERDMEVIPGEEPGYGKWRPRRSISLIRLTTGN
jgi:hypothetical protein